MKDVSKYLKKSSMELSSSYAYNSGDKLQPKLVQDVMKIVEKQINEVKNQLTNMNLYGQDDIFLSFDKLSKEFKEKYHKKLKAGKWN